MLGFASFPKFRQILDEFASFLNYEWPDKRRVLLGRAGGKILGRSSPWGSEGGRRQSEEGEGGRELYTELNESKKVRREGAG